MCMRYSAFLRLQEEDVQSRWPVRVLWTSLWLAEEEEAI